MFLGSVALFSPRRTKHFQRKSGSMLCQRKLAFSGLWFWMICHEFVWSILCSRTKKHTRRWQDILNLKTRNFCNYHGTNHSEVLEGEYFLQLECCIKTRGLWLQCVVNWKATGSCNWSPRSNFSKVLACAFPSPKCVNGFLWASGSTLTKVGLEWSNRHKLVFAYGWSILRSNWQILA